ncbi:inactive phospholipase C protein 2, partial [Biomphalaria glabrata]
ELEIKRADGKRGRLSSEEFISLFKEISTRPEIYFLLVRYSSNADFMSTEDLLLFLEAEQGVSYSHCFCVFCSIVIIILAISSILHTDGKQYIITISFFMYS